MPETLLFGIIKTLGSAKEIGRLWGVKDEIESLRSTVSTIEDVLLDAEEKHAAGHLDVTRWLGRLEDAMYDADDLLDEICTEALQREVRTRDKKAKKVRIFFSKSNQLASWFKIARKIKAIRKKLDAIDADRQSFNLEVRHVEKRVGGNRQRDNTTHSFLPTPKLSYDDLPSELKHCFAYCSLYPKDYRICRSTLIRLWIAQGFVKSFDDPNRCLEEVGNEYFMHLLERKFFQEPEMDEFGIVIQCKMHDMMHDLAVSVAGSLITTLDGKKTNLDEKTRHVSFVGDRDTLVSSISTSLCKPSRIRTFLLPEDCRYFGLDGAEIDCDAIISSSKVLRVLDLNEVDLDFPPSSIEKLKHLRYLDLSGNSKIKKLPDSITRLPNLQTLRLSACLQLEELPRDIKKLVNLRHLEIGRCIALTYMPRGLGHLTNLQTLSRFLVLSDRRVVLSGSPSKHIGGLKELNGLINLRGSLAIEGLGHEKDVSLEYEGANLMEKQHLHALQLQWCVAGSVNPSDVDEDRKSLDGFQPHQNLKQLELFGYRGSEIPRWLLSLTNLVTFNLYSCLECQYLPPLSRLPSLKYLALSELDALKYISEEGDGNEFASSSVPVPLSFLPSLKEIELSYCPKLRGWWRRDSSEEANSDSHNSVEITEHLFFLHLSKLSIKFCPLLTSMPMFPHLEKLDLDKTGSEPLKQTMKMDMAALQSPTSTATTSSSSTPLSKLKSMKLNSIWPPLRTLSLHNLTSLERMNFFHLESLSIDNCLELGLLNGIQRNAGRGLRSLHLSRLPKLVSFSPRHRFTDLQELKILDCESLTALPEWLKHCQSLQELEIGSCSNLASLPEGMGMLKSLRMLKIADCPILFPKCQGPTGEYWGWISRIPKREIS